MPKFESFPLSVNMYVPELVKLSAIDIPATPSTRAKLASTLIHACFVFIVASFPLIPFPR